MIRSFVLVTVLTLVPADTREPEWQLDLEMQLLEQKQCEMLYVTRPRESELGGERTVSGRAHCADGRNFDFSRLRSYQPFEFKDCEPVIC